MKNILQFLASFNIRSRIMKKKELMLALLLTGLASKAFASAGHATDSLEFLLVILGFLLVVAGLLHGTNYLRKNGKRMIRNVSVFFRKQVGELGKLLHREKPDAYDLSSL